MSFWDGIQTDRWDPDNDGIFDVTYGMPSEGNFVKNPNGDYKHYVAVEGNNNYYNQINDMYWKKDGTIYYSLRNAPHKYIKVDNYLNSEGTDVRPLGQIYASDDQLDAVADLIIASENQKQLDKIEEQKKDSAPKKESGSLADVAIPTENTEAANKATDQYNQKLKSADLRLQNLIASEDNSTDYVPISENTNNSTTYYKYGDNEIDLKYYLHNLSTNLQNYINSQNWNKGQKEAFRKAYEAYKTGLSNQLTNKSSRFSTDDSGILIDSQGLLDGVNDHVFIDKNGNTYNSLDDITDKKLRKSAVEFSPNDEVANYFNTIGQAIVGAGKVRQTTSEETESDFDLNKDGFINYWNSRVNPAGGETDLSPYLDLDPVGPDGKRKRTNRTKYLIHELNNYITKINSGKLKFDKSTFKSKDAFITKIRQAINNLSNGWDSSDPASLQEIGITPEFYTAFMSEASNPLATDEEVAAAKAEADTKNKANAASDYIAEAEKRYKAYSENKNHWTADNNHQLTINIDKSINPDKNPQVSQQVAASKLNNFGYKIDLSTDSGKTVFYTALDNLWDSIKQSLREGNPEVQTPNGLKPIDELLSIIMPFALSENGEFQTDPDNPDTKVIDDPEHDFVNGTILCYKDGKLYYDWIFHHKKCSAWQKLKSNFEEHYGKVTDPDKPKYSFDKNGGILRKFEPGGNLDVANMSPEELQSYVASLQSAEAETPKEEEVSDGFLHPKQFSLGEAVLGDLYKTREDAAKAKGMSYEQYNKKQRKQNAAPDLYNADNGVWKTEDYVRAGSILTDIVSMALPSVAGGVANVGSTAASFFADWLDDSVTGTEMWKNLGMNLGMDALSLIPVVGDAAGTGGKLIKSVKKIAPKIMYGLTAWGILGTLKNGSNIMESLQKVTSDEKLTVGDWQNIAQAITAIAGINNGVKAGAAKRMAKKKAKIDDAIGLGVHKIDADGNNIGNKQDIILKGKHATEIKKLIAEGKSPEDVNKYLQNIEGFSNYEVNTNLSSVPISTNSPIDRRLGDDGKKHWGIHNPFSVARKIDAFEIFDKNKLRSGYASRTRLNTNRQDAVESNRLFTDEDLLTKAEVDVLQKQQIDALTADAKANTEKRKARIQEIQERIEGTKDADGKVINKGLEDLIKETEADAKQKVTERQSLEQQLNGIVSKQHNLDTRVLGKRVYHINDSDKFTAKKSIIEAESADLEKQINLKNKRIAKLEAKIESLGTTSKSNKTYTQLESELNTLSKARDQLQIQKDKKDSIIQELEAWKTDHDEVSKLGKKISNTYDDESRFNVELAKYNSELASLKRILEKTNPNGIQNATSHSKQKILDLIADEPFYVTYGRNGKREVKDIKQIIEDMHLLKKGGRLEFLAKGGTAVSGVQLNQNAGSWYDQVFNNYKDFILDNLSKNNDYYNTINSMQDAHYNIYTEAGGDNGSWKNQAYEGKNNSVRNYQNKYDLEEFNDRGIKPNYNTRYAYHPKTTRTSKDDPTNNFYADNYYSSITDDRRVLGRKDDWTPEQFNSFNKELKDKGYEMYSNEDNGYYYLRKLGSPTIETVHSPKDFNLLNIDEGRAGGSDDSNKNQSSIKNKFLDGLSKAFKNNGPNPFEYVRYRLLDNANKRMARNAIANEKPYLQTPLVDNVQIQTDLRAENEGEKENAELMSQASKAIVNDIAQRMAFIKEAHKQGQKYKDAGYKVSDQKLDTTTAADVAQRKENHRQEHLVGEQNRLSALQSLSNRNAIWNAYLSKHANERDVFLKGWQAKIDANNETLKKLNESAILTELAAAIKNNPNNYGANLTPSELAIYKKGQAGYSTEKMTDIELNDYYLAANKVNAAARRQQYKYYGIPESIYSTDAYNFSNKKSFVPQLTQLAKDGAKIANIKAKLKMKNADRTAKNIEKQIDNLNKKLEIISKSMYGLPKVQVIK